MGHRESKKPGVLLLHGFGGTPFEMLGLGEKLSAGGFTVDNPLLPGHGENVDAWRRTGFEDWAALALERFDALGERADKVGVAGLSMGGSLALHIAEHRRPDAVMTIAAPVFLHRFFPWASADWRLPLLPLLRMFRPVWPAKARSEESRRIAPWKGYEEGVALGPLASFMRGLKRVRRDLHRVEAPLLVLHCPEDAAAPAANAGEILGRVSSGDKRLEWMAVRECVTGRHCLTTHLETRERVEELALGFFNDKLRG
jgi:carboxylesterase